MIAIVDNLGNHLVIFEHPLLKESDIETSSKYFESVRDLVISEIRLQGEDTVCPYLVQNSLVSLLISFFLNDGRLRIRTEFDHDRDEARVFFQVNFGGPILIKDLEANLRVGTYSKKQVVK